MNWIQAEKKALLQVYRRQPLVLVRAQGSWVWDQSGKKYLDFFSGLGVNNLGHRHPSVVRAAVAQLNKLIHVSNLFYTTPQIACAQQLIQRTFPGKVFFCNSGAEANECAVKFARRWGGRDGKSRPEIISFQNSFHGRTLAALTLTGQPKVRKGFDPLPEKAVYAHFNDIDSVRALQTPRTAAVFIEPVQGEGGVYPATKDFLRALRRLCDQSGLLLIFDEVQCGLGRSGKLFSFQSYNVKPDILLAAKGLGGGLPIGALIVQEKIAGLLGPGDHASTFGGNPVVCAAAEAVLNTMSPAFLSDVEQKGKELGAELLGLKRQFPELIREVRGLGLMQALELSVNGEGIVKDCRDRGLLINCTQEKVLRFLPCLTLSRAEMKKAFAILEKALRAVLG